MQLAFVVSHPVQYYVPLYRSLASHPEIQVRVFYTWHGNSQGQNEPGFGRHVKWDIPLTDGYDFEVVPNISKKPGTHHFFGIRNPGLTSQVLQWKPDAVHLTGYAYPSHLALMRHCHRHGVPLLFRGDSHVLDSRGGLRSVAKSALLRAIYRWPSAFLAVGSANRDYYRAYAVPESKLFHCPHSIDVARFAEPHDELECAAAEWRRELGIASTTRVLVFAGKFEEKKQPLPLARAFLAHAHPGWLLLMVGDGKFRPQLEELAAAFPERLKLLPFQNQSRMPLVYRLGDIFTLPSAYGETWGLAVNEALACGRPVLVSDKVGCARDLVCGSRTGSVFRAGDWDNFQNVFAEMKSRIFSPPDLQKFAWSYDTRSAAVATVATLSSLRLLS
jgi:glycosyltransferase involved in cell wall biosynthesis